MVIFQCRLIVVAVIGRQLTFDLIQPKNETLIQFFVLPPDVTEMLELQNGSFDRLLAIVDDQMHLFEILLIVQFNHRIQMQLNDRVILVVTLMEFFFQIIQFFLIFLQQIAEMREREDGEGQFN